MDEQRFYKEAAQLKHIKEALSEALSAEQKEPSFINNLLRKFPTKQASKLLNSSVKDFASLKRLVKDLYLEGKNNTTEFKKALSLLFYINQIEEHNLNTEKFWADIKKNNEKNTRKYLESQKELEILSKQRIQQERKEEESKHESIIHKFEKEKQTLLKRFFEVANRKVSIINEYGQPSWEYLYLEIAKFIEQLADEKGIHITNHHIGLYKRTKNPDVFIGDYSSIARFLEASFRKQFNPKKLKLLNVNDLSGIEFEAYVAQLLTDIGALDIMGTTITGDQGADLLFRIGTRKIAAQVKRHTQPIGNYAIQEIVGAIRYYDTDDGWAITNTTFTPSAIALAQKNDVVLIDGNRLSNLKDFLESLYKYSAFVKSS